MVLVAVSGKDHYSGGGEKTVAKTVILDKYLKAYLDIMKQNWTGQKWYVDTHAGTGFKRGTDGHLEVARPRIDRLMENYVWLNFGNFFKLIFHLLLCHCRICRRH